MKTKKRLLIAGMFVIAAVLFGGGFALAQRANLTEVVGGPGGSAFLDPEIQQGARVVEVQVHSGEYVDSVQLVYMLDDGRTVMGPQHGGPGGQLGVFHLDADEYLVGASGRVGDYIDSIEFQTNKRTSPTFGGSGGRRDFHVGVPPDEQVTGLAGRGGQYLDAIGLTFGPLRRRIFSQSRLGAVPQPGQSLISGGTGGDDFIDADMPAGARIIEVRVRSGEYIDSIQMIYSLPGGRSVEAARHGGDGGRSESFRLQPDEYIVGISGRCGQYVDSVQIRTNKRTSGFFGGRGGDREYRVDVPDGNQVTGFMGRSGEYLDAIGVTFGRARDPRGRESDRRHDQ